MSETISTDYINMINKQGSGYNIPEIVDAIVDAAIVPVKEIVTTQKEKVDASISGMATFKQSAQATQTLISAMSSASAHTLKQSPNSNYMRSTITDSSKITAATHVIQNIVIAKPMIWRMDGETNLSRSLSDQTLTFEFGNINTSNNNLAPSSPARSTQVSFSGDTLASGIAKINEISGVKAELVQLSSNSDNYSVVLTSDTGSQNGFKMTSSIAGFWETASSGNGTFTQDSTDATFKLNDQNYTRASNVVSDIVPGLQIDLLSNRSNVQTITVSKSSENIKNTVETLIGDLNAYKADLNALGLIDEVGDKDGDLVDSSYLRMAKRQFRSLMSSPITGFGDANIYFVEFGIKTAKDGSFVFDQTTFDRTFANEPHKFDALTNDKSYATDSTSSLVSLSNAGLPPGKYTYRNSDQKIISAASSEVISTTVSGSDSNYTRTASAYPGFVLNTATSNPSNFDFYIGHSAKSKLENFFTDTLATSSNYKTTLDLYETKSVSLDAKLEKIDLRETFLQSMYTKQFADMEKIVTGSSSSSDYITQLVDGWKK